MSDAFDTGLSQAQRAFGPTGRPSQKLFAGLLYLHRFDLHQRPLLQLGKRHRLPSPGEDMGYLVHAALTALFGDLAPRTFSITHQNPRVLQVLGYSEHALEELQDHACMYALPEAQAICDPYTIQSKQMPVRWKTGTVLGYRTRVCPTVRLREEKNHHHQGAEVDAFLVAQWENPEADRTDTYKAWLAKEIESSAKILAAQLDNFHLEFVTRRTHNRDPRSKHGLRKPSASFSGALEITNGELFGAALARGIGRHRAFGLGMLLLHPWRA